jgi:hypothetical protein
MRATILQKMADSRNNLAPISVALYDMSWYGPAMETQIRNTDMTSKLIKYGFTVIATKSDGAITETKFHGSYDSDAQAELMARDAASNIEGAEFVRITRHGVEWSINS